jgi:hypothetical protein
MYIGLKENEKPEIFVSEKDPTKGTHPKYDIIYGPFTTVKEAENYVNAMGNLACGNG